MTIVSLTLLAGACVPVSQVQDIKDKYSKAEEQRKYLSSQNDKLEKENTELKADVKRLNGNVEQMISDTAKTGQRYRDIRYQFDKLRGINEELMQKQSELASGSQAENRKLMAELLVIQEDLQEKEDRLKLLEIELNKKSEHLNALSDDLEKTRAELMELEKELLAREARVNELESIIAQKDQALSALKDKVKAALTSFEGKGITVEERNGRIYVSMEAKLLFASGSTTVGTEGKKAVVQLAKALENQNDLTILVEGHTDNDPIRGKIKDNWDLSVMRATSVVRIMTENSEIDEAILTAAGRGEFLPIGDNNIPAEKAKNRRIEVILTPNLDKLFEILDEAAGEVQQNNEDNKEEKVSGEEHQ